MSFGEVASQAEKLCANKEIALGVSLMPTNVEMKEFFSVPTKSFKSSNPEYLEFGNIYEKTSQLDLANDFTDQRQRSPNQIDSTPHLPNAQESTYIFRALEYIDKMAHDPATGGLEQGGSINAQTGEAHSAIPGRDHANIPLYSGTSDIVMTHHDSYLNNPGFRNSPNPERNDYLNAINHHVRMWAINKDGNIFMFDPQNQHVYEWLKNNKTPVPDLDLGIRASAAMFPTKFEKKAKAQPQKTT